MQNDITQEAKAYLEKEIKRAGINIERAKSKNGSSTELDGLRRKLDILTYLLYRC